MLATLEDVPVFARAVVAADGAGVDVDHLRVESDVLGVGRGATDAARVHAVRFGSVGVAADELEGTVLFVQVEVDGEVRDQVRVELLHKQNEIKGGDSLSGN